MDLDSLKMEINSMKCSVMSMGFGYLFQSGVMSYKDFLDFCADVNFDGIEPSDRQLRQLDPSKLWKWLKDRNLEVATVDIGGNFAQPDENLRRQAIESTEKMMDVAHKLGSRQVMIVPGHLIEGTSLEDARRWAFEGLLECVDYGESIGIQATAEDHGNPVSLRGSVHHLIEMIEKIPKIGICYDVGNFVFSGEDPLESLKKVISHVVHVHVKDWKFVDERHPRASSWLVDGKHVASAVPGEGIIDLKNVLKELKQAGYEGYLSVEYGGRTLQVKEGVARALKYLRATLKEI